MHQFRNMRVFVFFLLVAAVAAAPPAKSNEVTKLGNSVDELVKQVFEYVRALLIKHEPYDFPAMPEQKITDTDIDLLFATSNVKLSKAEDFTVDKISNNLDSLVSTFGVTVPQAHLEGQYTVTGKAFKKDVQGSGTFSVDIIKFVQTGEINFGIVDHSLQIKDLKLDYKLDGAKFDVEGLNIEGRSKEEIEEFLNKGFLSYLEKNKAVVEEKVADHAKAKINLALKGKSLQDVIDFLKDIVVSTPDPPPFPFTP